MRLFILICEGFFFFIQTTNVCSSQIITICCTSQILIETMLCQLMLPCVDASLCLHGWKLSPPVHCWLAQKAVWQLADKVLDSVLCEQPRTGDSYCCHIRYLLPRNIGRPGGSRWQVQAQSLCWYVCVYIQRQATCMLFVIVWCKCSRNGITRQGHLVLRWHWQLWL